MGSALFSSARLDEDDDDEDSKPKATPDGDGDVAPPSDQSAAAATSTARNAALQSAYALQLSQLSNLGLVSRFGLPECLAILERLTAANVGSGEGDVTVEQVIHELLKVEG